MEKFYGGDGWYFRVREKFLRNQLACVPDGVDVLDVGCGNGLVSRLLDRCNVTGIDPEIQYPSVISASADNIPFPDQTFNIVTCFDVLEHVTDHEKAIREIRRVLKQEGMAFFAVPLYPKLWSQHDEVLGHVRRYQPGELTFLLKKTGVNILSIKHFMSLLLPVVTIIRLINPRGKAVSSVRCSPYLEKLLEVICKLELIANGNLPIGLTEFIVIKR